MQLPFTPGVRRHLSHAFIALSVANLVFVRRWYDLRVLQVPEVHYLQKASPSLGQELLLAILGAVLVLAAALWAGWRLVDRSSHPLLRKVAYCAFLAVLMIPFESIRRYWNVTNQRADLVTNVFTIGIQLALVVGIVMAWRGSHRILRAARGAALFSVFLLPATVFVFATGFSFTHLEFVSRKSLPIVSGPDAHRPRFLWLIMDEFDKKLAFDTQPSPVELPELRRLMAESMVASQANQVQNYTLAAIPSLLTGTKVSDVSAADPNTLLVNYPGEDHAVSWRERKNVFQRAHEQGIDAAVAGWYHPYCRVLGDQVASCFTEAAEQSPALQLNSYTRSAGWAPSVLFLLRLQAEHLVSLFTGEPLSGLLRLQSEEVQKQMQRQYFAIRDHAYQAATDPSIDFGYFHFPTPHMLPIYNRRKRTFELDSSLNYFDNLALVDRTIGELRQRLETAGLWDQTTILIMSDHGLRPAMWRGGIGWDDQTETLVEAEGPSLTVPFILKIAGDREPAVLDAPFSTLLSGDLALAVLNGEIKTNAEAVEWIRVRSVAHALVRAASTLVSMPSEESAAPPEASR